MSAFGKCKVVSKLYYSTDTDTATAYASQAKQIGITSVIVLSEGDFNLHFADFEYTQSPILNSVLLPKLPIIHEKISIGMQRGGSWVISSDPALTAAVIISFMMTTLYKSLPLKKATRVVQKFINASSAEYTEQLEIWQSMGAEIDTKHIDWINYQRAYKVSHEDILLGLMAQTSKKTTRFIPVKQKRSASMTDLFPRTSKARSGSVDGDANNQQKIQKLSTKWKAKKLEVVALSSPSIGVWGYCCTNCKKKLFSQENIVQHSSSPVTLDPVHSRCSYITIEPMRWIGNSLLEPSGTITCYGCSEELGVWDWKKWSGCGCGTKMKTAFAIQKSKITFVDRNISSGSVSPAGMLSPRTKRKSKLGGMLSRKNFQKESEEKDKSTGKKEVKEDKSKTMPPVFATRYEELTKDLQKYITKAKLDTYAIDQNWYAATQVFRFIAKCRVIPMPQPPEEEAANIIKAQKGRELTRLLSSHYGTRAMLKGTENEHLIEQFTELPSIENDKEEEEEEEDADADLQPFETPLGALAEEYIAKIIGEPIACSLDITDPNTPTYFEVMKAKYILSENPKDTIKILQRTGKGGFGSVYVAKDSTAPSKHNRVAVKRMPHSKKKEILSNFREIEFLSKCTHTNIVKFSRAYCLKDEIWMVMEYMEGGSLKEASDSYSFQESHIAYIAKETLKALQYMHNVGLVHRDLKPGNIMLTVSGIVKLIDFGLCDETHRVVRNPRMVGSPYWMPPEIILKAPYNEKVDIWSLGVTLLELIDRKGFEQGNAFSCLFKTATEGRPNAFSSDNYSSNLRSFVQAMLTKDVAKRPSAEELLQHPFLNCADTRRNMEKVISQIFISNVVGITGF